MRAGGIRDKNGGVCLHPLSGCQGCDAQQCDYCSSIPGLSLFPKGVAEAGATGRAAGVFPRESSGAGHGSYAPQWRSPGLSHQTNYTEEKSRGNSHLSREQGSYLGACASSVSLFSGYRGVGKYEVGVT